MGGILASLLRAAFGRFVTLGLLGQGGCWWFGAPNRCLHFLANHRSFVIPGLIAFLFFACIIWDIPRFRFYQDFMGKLKRLNDETGEE